MPCAPWAHDRCMTDTNMTLRDRVLDHDDDLRDALEILLQNAIRRQMWLLFVDDRGCLGGPLMPMDDYPEDPREIVDVDDLGDVEQAHLLMHRMSMLLQSAGHASIILVWERRGSSVTRPEDQAWAGSMAEAAAELGVPLRAQFVLHDTGVRQLHPDDYL